MAAVAVLVVTTVVAVVGAVRSGVTTDEPIHVMRLRNLLANGWYALDWDYQGAGPGGDTSNTFVYAPVAMLLLHAWSVLWGVEGWSTVSTTPHAYDVRHLGVVVIGLVGLAAVVGLGRVVLRRWRWGVVAAACLAAMPMWTGHTMFNVKDVPVATGYTLVTLGLVLMVRSDPVGTRLGPARIVCLAAGLVLALGTRPGMWSGLFASLVAATVTLVVLGVHHERRAALGAFAELVAGCALAAVVLVATYPKLFGDPLHAMPRTTESSASFLAGLRSDRLYVPRHFLEEVPTILALFVVTGSVAGVVLLVRRWRADTVAAGRLALVGVQVFAMPVVAIVLGSDLYHGLRQLLFAAPAAAVLAAYGIAWWQGRLTTRSPRRRKGLVVVAVVGLVAPAVDEVAMAPYDTTYVNLATDIVTTPFVGARDRPGGDFWRVSIPELVDGISAGTDLDRQLLCKAGVDEVTGEAYRFLNGGAYSTTRSTDCRVEDTGPLAPERMPAVEEGPDAEYDAVFLKAVPPNCRPLREVTRERHLVFRVVLTILARCTTPVPVLDSPVSATDPGLGKAGDHDLWRFAVDGWLQWPGRDHLVAPDRVAKLGFRVPEWCRESGCWLDVAGTMPGDMVVSVDGGQTTPTRDAGGLRIAVTAEQAASEDGVWVTFRSAGGGTLGATLTAIRLSEDEVGS